MIVNDKNVEEVISRLDGKPSIPMQVAFALRLAFSLNTLNTFCMCPTCQQFKADNFPDCLEEAFQVEFERQQLLESNE